MAVAIGPVFLLLASILLGAVLLLGAFGILWWVTRYQRRMRGEVQGRLWEHDASDLAGRDRTSVVASGK